MNKILKFKDYSNWEDMTFEFVNLFNSQKMNESETEIEDDSLNGLIKDILKRLGFDLSLVLTFGTGVKLMYPIVSNLIENMNLEINPSKEDVVLLCITAFSIMFLYNKKSPLVSSEDIKNKLNPEIAMKFGNPRIIVNKILKCFNYIYLFIKRFPKLFGVALTSIIDMFSYTLILQPVMNAISSFVDKYDWTPDTIIGNLTSLGAGISTIGITKLLDYIKKKINKTSGEELDQEMDPEEIDMGRNTLIKERQ